MENSLLLDRTPRRAGPPVLSSSEPSPSAFVVTVLPPSVHANLCSQAAPFQSTCKYKTPLKLTLVPSLSVLRASKGMQVKRISVLGGNVEGDTSQAVGGLYERCEATMGTDTCKTLGWGQHLHDSALYLFLLNCFTQLFVLPQSLQTDLLCTFFHTGMVTRAKQTWGF